MPTYEPRQLTTRRLFDVATESLHTFCVGGDQDDWHRYALGYKNAAGVRAERLTTKHGVSTTRAYRHSFSISTTSS
jgi:hypothetical protein